MPYIDVQTGVKHGNPADSQVQKSGHPPAILGVRMPGCHLFYTLAMTLLEANPYSSLFQPTGLRLLEVDIGLHNVTIIVITEQLDKNVSSCSWFLFTKS